MLVEEVGEILVGEGVGMGLPGEEQTEEGEKQDEPGEDVAASRRFGGEDRGVFQVKGREEQECEEEGSFFPVGASPKQIANGSEEDGGNQQECAGLCRKKVFAEERECRQVTIEVHNVSTLVQFFQIFFTFFDIVFSPFAFIHIVYRGSFNACA